MSTLVCFALKEEAGAFRKLMASRADVSVLLTGIGQQNARRRVLEYLSRNTPQLVLTSGFAGGLNPALQVGDIVFSTEDAVLRNQLATTGANPATIHCATRVAVTVSEKQALRQSTGADAVEMESEVIQGICRERGIPCVTIRGISDAASDDLPLDFNALSKPDQSLDFARLAWTLLKQPGKIPSLLRLQKNCQFTAGRLAEVLNAIVSSELAVGLKT